MAVGCMLPPAGLPGFRLSRSLSLGVRWAVEPDCGSTRGVEYLWNARKIQFSKAPSTPHLPAHAGLSPPENIRSFQKKHSAPG